MSKQNKIISLVSECSPSSVTVSRESHLINDLEFDDLDRIELIMELESKFNITISENEAYSFNTVADVINLVEGKSK